MNSEEMRKAQARIEEKVDEVLRLLKSEQPAPQPKRTELAAHLESLSF